MGIGERIRSLREEAGLSQTELAKYININNSVLSRIEAGKRAVEDQELKTIADYFKVNADYLLGRKSTPTFTDSDHSLSNINDWSEEEQQIAKAVIETLRQLKNQINN